MCWSAEGPKTVVCIVNALGWLSKCLVGFKNFIASPIFLGLLVYRDVVCLYWSELECKLHCLEASCLRVLVIIALSN